MRKSGLRSSSRLPKFDQSAASAPTGLLNAEEALNGKCQLDQGTSPAGMLLAGYRRLAQFVNSDRTAGPRPARCMRSTIAILNAWHSNMQR
jgi:hypothetical protein